MNIEEKDNVDVVVFSQHFLLARVGFYVTDLSGQQRDLQLYVESEPHQGLTFYHQKYNPLTPWWNERGSNPRLSDRKRALNPLGHQAARKIR